MSNTSPFLSSETSYLETTHVMAHEILEALWDLQDQQRELIHQATRVSELLADRTGTVDEDSCQPQPEGVY